MGGRTVLFTRGLIGAFAHVSRRKWGFRTHRSGHHWQADVADRSGGRLSRTQIANLESGARRVDLDDLPVLCEALGITLRELLEGADTRTRKALGL